MKKLCFVFAAVISLLFAAANPANAEDITVTLEPTTFPTTEACDPDHYANCPTQTMVATLEGTYTDFRHIMRITEAHIDSLGGSITITADNCSGKRLYMLGTCTITMSFQPLQPVSYQANLVINYSLGALADSKVVSVSGSGYAPAPHLYPSSINFGKKSLNSEKEWLYVEISNQARTSMEISDTILNELLSNAAFGVDTTCKGAVLEPAVEAEQSTCNMGVSFEPTDPATVDQQLEGFAEVYVAHLLGDQQVNLLGTVVAADSKDVKISAAGLYFGDQTIGEASTAKSFTITNIGALNVTMGAITVDDAQFSITDNDCPGVGVELNPGDVCTVEVTFTPNAPAGLKTGTITIEDDAEDHPQTVALRGNAIDPNAPSVSLSSRNLDFGNQTVGISTKQYVTLTNKGGANLEISTVTAAGNDQFTVVEPDTDCDDNTIAPDARCKIVIQYAPTEPAPAEATVTITDNAADSPQTIELEGTGTQAKTPSVQLSSTDINFGNQIIDTTRTQNLTITNNGTSDLQISLTALDGTGVANFSKLDGCIGTVVQPNSTCTVAISFYPTELQSYLATLSVADNASDSPQSVILRGSGASAPSSGCSLIR